MCLIANRAAIAKRSLKYYSMKLACKFGRKVRKRAGRVQNTKTFRQECLFEVYIILSSDGQGLKVRRVNEVHNHSITKELYEHLPRQQYNFKRM